MTIRPSAPAAPGWYPDEDDSGRVRYFDGLEWTARHRPRPQWAPLELRVVQLRDVPEPSRRRLPGVIAGFLIAAIAFATVLGGRAVGLRGGSSAQGARALDGAAWQSGAQAVCARAMPALGIGLPALGGPVLRAVASGGSGLTSSATGSPAGEGRRTGGVALGGPVLRAPVSTSALLAATSGAPVSRRQLAALASTIRATGARLASLAARGDQHQAVQSWLTEWARLSQLLTMAAGSARPALQLPIAEREVTLIDAFARSHDVPACQL